ncbi:MAG TPA: LysR family transcriptional regulator, partial [Oceanicaulis sp.]|nr:LysR family transcriptional regulator [Oceanicaulis sp.]
MLSLADRIDLDLVSAFLAVARTGSFTRAGEEVLRTQSAVSLQIRRLERVLGERLFRRNARAVTLTPAGERFLPFAERL